MGLQHHRRINLVSAAVFDTDMIRTLFDPLPVKGNCLLIKRRRTETDTRSMEKKRACLAIINYNTDDRAGEKNSSCRPFVSHR